MHAWICAHECSALRGQKEALYLMVLGLLVIASCLMWQFLIGSDNLPGVEGLV